MFWKTGYAVRNANHVTVLSQSRKDLVLYMESVCRASNILTFLCVVDYIAVEIILLNNYIS